ncbi:MAG: UDP-N-acetylmuramoyl-L-alanine--D-glutamate ligase [Chloroflexota bacterium]
MSDSLSNKKLVILGLARQGTALARFAVGVGASVVVSDMRSAEQLQETIDALSDLPAEQIEFVLGEHPMSLLDGADLLAPSGGVPLDSPIVVEARNRDIPLTNDSLEFMRRAPSLVIGITGSAGKTTTTALTGLMSQIANKQTWIGGNIGRPLIEDVYSMTPDDIVVQELSSFQLDLWEDTSTDIAAILNITPNHLDRHKSMENYSHAKSNILRHQRPTDIAVLSADDPRTLQLQPLVQGRLRLFSREEAVHDGAFIHDDKIWLNDGAGRIRIVCPVDTMHLRGQHNVRNALAAAVLAESAGIPDNAIAEAIRTFSGVPHRLELVRTINGIQYVNDSIATAPERSIAALESFEEPIILLAGGRDKDMEWEEWARRVGQRAKHVILFGQLAPQLADYLDGLAKYTQADDLASAVASAHDLAETGDVVLLSPGGTSYDSYNDFVERGDEFRTLVRALEMPEGA